MRHILLVPVLLLGSVSGLPIAAFGFGQARAASFAIDPDPGSPTLGDILDREARSRTKRPKKAIVPPPPQKVVTEPIIPSGAVTVLTPRVRPRVIPIHAQPGKPASR